MLKNEIVKRDSWEMILGGGPGLTLSEDTVFEEWDDLGKKLRYIEQFIQFKLGDWLNSGSALYGEKYSQALEDTDYAKQTLADFAWVCGKIPIESRNPHVSFGHHKVVAKLDSFQQIEELQYAQESKMTMEEFRQYIKGKYGVKPNASSNLPKDDEPLNILTQILKLVRSRKLSALPKASEVAWMQQTIKDVEKLCVRIVED